jgi:hypothetical protein
MPSVTTRASRHQREMNRQTDDRYVKLSKAPCVHWRGDKRRKTEKKIKQGGKHGKNVQGHRPNELTYFMGRAREGRGWNRFTQLRA